MNLTAFALRRPVTTLTLGVLPMDANEPVVVYTTNNLSQAEILKNVLEGEGIECELDGENQGGFVGVVDVRLVVRRL